MSTSEAQTRPPVQDSAVAIVILRILQRSSRARARERISLALTGSAPSAVVPRQADGRAGRRRHAFFAAGETQSLAGGRLHRYTGDRHFRNLGDARTHRVAMRSDLRLLADQRDLEA